MSPLTPERYAQHIKELGRAFHIRVLIDKNAPPDVAGAGFRGNLTCPTMYIRIPPVHDETSYAVALHELGHCASPLGMCAQAEGSRKMRRSYQPATLRDMRLKLEEERAAWDWAQHYALEWTPIMASVRAMTLGTYEKRARQLGIIKN